MGEMKTQDKPAGLSPKVALLLSIVVLPGLGQLLTGRLLKGALMAGAVMLWLPAAVIKAMVDLNKVMPELSRRAASGEALMFSDLQAAMQPMAGSLLWLFLPLVVIWFWTLGDSILYILQQKEKRQ